MSEVPLYPVRPRHTASNGRWLYGSVGGWRVEKVSWRLANDLCSGVEAGSYLRRIDFVYHSTLGLRVIKKKRRGLVGVAVVTIVERRVDVVLPLSSEESTT